MKIWIPCVDEFARAFAELGDQLSENERRILKIHYDASGRIITAEILAEAMGYASFGGANLQYGRLAAKLCRQLDANPEFKSQILCTFVAPFEDKDNVHWLWIMRPEVAEALEKLQWV
jgi:5-methylcytosine-specific restriction protein A